MALNRSVSALSNALRFISRKQLRRRKSNNGNAQYSVLEPRKLMAGLLISEFVASNSDSLVDDNGNSTDWIELFNDGPAINLAGYSLSDDPSDPSKFVFQNTTLEASQYLVVFAGDDQLPNSGTDIYTGFGLSSSGEHLGLYGPFGNLLSEFGAGGADYPAQFNDISYGVLSGGNFDQVSYFATPTPGAANTNPIAGVAERVEATVDAGFYENSFQVSLSTTTQGATIRYTLDGSTPSATNGLDYSNSVTISKTTNLRAVAIRSDFLSVPDRTWSYIFVDDVLDQSYNGALQAGFPAAGSLGNKFLDYGIDPEVIGIEGEQAVKDALLAIPTWSITTDIDNLFDPNTGIYANATEGGRDWERPASVELLNPDGSEGFQVNAGIRIRGGASRGDDNPKHAFRLFFRGEYGDSKLEYPVHGSEGTDTFDKIDLRTAQNYSWSKDGDDSNTFITDRLARLAQQALGQPSTRSTWMHLYINGQYWGLYETQERAEADFGATYFGGEAENYDVIKPIGRNDPGAYTNFATDGNTDAYERLFVQALARDGNSEVPNFVNQEAYLRAQGLNLDGTRNPNYEVLLDVDNLITYMTVIFSTTNRDAPISQFRGNRQLNNYYAMRDRTGDEGFRFFIHDSEHGMRDLNRDRTGPFNHENFESGVEYFNPQWLHQQLMANDDYRIEFADKIYESHFNDGVMTAENQLARLETVRAEIDQAIIAESARWGDAKQTSPLLRQDWLGAINNLRSFVNNRNDSFLNQLRNTNLVLKDSNGDYNVVVDAPLFPDVEAPDFIVDGTVQSGGLVDQGSELQLSSNAPNVYYTLDGSDPRSTGGSVSSTAIDFGIDTDRVIESGDSWRYNDTGANLSAAWRQPSYNDTVAGWSSGISELGYGDGDEATVVSFGSNGNNKHITTYFRNTFNVANAGNYDTATIRLKRDDGAVVYLNGSELFRSNIDVGPVTSETRAMSTVANGNERNWFEFDIDPALLLSGSNTLAVEIHQISPSSSDITFDLELILEALSPASVTFDGLTTVNARSLAADGTWSPLHQASFFLEEASQANIQISEINYNPYAPTSAEIDAGFTDNDRFEFLELFNPHPAGTILLSGLQFDDGITFAFGDAELGPGERAVIVKDASAFALRYGSNVAVLGEYSGSLSNGGEAITLVDSAGVEISSVTYNDGGLWSAAADGDGASLVLDSDTTSNDLLGKYYSWRASVEYGGTPGEASVSPSGVVINEILAHTDLPDVDSIELFNPTGSSINIGGWFLSDSGNDLFQYQIPASTVLSAGGYLVFDQNDFGFGLSSLGDEVYLTRNDGGLPAFEDVVEFGATFNGDSVGRLPNGSGRLAHIASPTLGAANQSHGVSDLIISEVHYNPLPPTGGQVGVGDNDIEFVEVYNRSNQAIDLSQWRLRGDVDFNFPQITLEPGESIPVLGL